MTEWQGPSQRFAAMRDFGRANDHYGSFSTGSVGFACRCMSASLRKRPNCRAATKMCQLKT